MSNPTSFITTIDLSLKEKLQEGLRSREFLFSTPQYTLFSAKGKDVVVTLYTSGKLMVQGKGTSEIMEFFIEPEILKSFAYSHRELEQDMAPRIGIDEAGKGDYFGPLCIAGVYCDEEGVRALVKLGVKDSKKLDDKAIAKLSLAIKKQVPHEVIRIGPEKYNQLYEKFGNLNHLLAWGHATAIEALVNKTGCKKAIIDQFAHESVVLRALKKKGLELDLTQRHKGEEDVVVAAASILARDAFVYGIEKLSEQVGMTLPKGASKQVLVAGQKFVEKFGKEALVKVSKLHFKTTGDILAL